MDDEACAANSMSCPQRAALDGRTAARNGEDAHSCMPMIGADATHRSKVAKIARWSLWAIQSGSGSAQQPISRSRSNGVARKKSSW